MIVWKLAEHANHFLWDVFSGSCACICWGRVLDGSCLSGWSINDSWDYG